MSRVRYADKSQGLRVQVSQAQSGQVPSALLPEHGDSEGAVGALAPDRAQPHLAIALAEVDVRHALPRLEAGRRALEARDVPAEVLLVVDDLHPLRVLGGDEEERQAWRGLRVTDVLRSLGHVDVQLDATPAEGHGLEGFGTLEEAQLVRGGLETPPAPAVLLALDRPVPGELEGLLEAAERHVEDDHHLVVTRIEVRRLLGADPGELVDHEALLREAQHAGLEDVCGGVEDAMDELELGVDLELLHPPGHELVVAEELLDHLDGSAEAEETAEELRGLLQVDVRHRTPRCHLWLAYGNAECVPQTRLLSIESGTLRPENQPQNATFNGSNYECTILQYSIK